MAATDQTYRNVKTVHVVFGVSCVLMLGSVLWMFVQDYNREYKPIQRTFYDVEEQASLRVMLQQLPRGVDLEQKINNAEAARAAYAKAQEDMRPTEKRLAGEREVKDATYRSIKAKYDSAASYYDMAVEEAGKETGSRKTASVGELEHKKKSLAELRQQLDTARRELDAANLKFREEVTQKLDEPKRKMEDAEDELKRVTGAFDRFAKTTTQKKWGIGNDIRRLPIIDGFESPTKIKQIVLNDLTIDYAFKQVPRFDRCTSCHLGIDRAMFDKGALTALTQPPDELNSSLQKARKLLLERQRKGENLGFDPTDLPTHVEPVKLSTGEITQYAAHPRLDLFVDSNSPHPLEKFGCTICHSGQGSSTSFVFASHTPTDARQTEEWQKNYDWKSIHDWDYPMHASRFVEASCLQCHHQVTDLIRHGSKEEAPKLLRGYNLVKENGCFGCHEISGFKGGRPVGPDLRLEPTPALELLSDADQDKTKADTQNPPGTMRKVGPGLRRIAEKTNEEWARKWIKAPREFREDTKMPHFFGLSTNTSSTLPDDQKKFPDAEIHAIAHYLFAESKAHLKGHDTGREALISTMNSLQTLSAGSVLGKEETEKLALLEAKRTAKKLSDDDRREWVAYSSGDWVKLQRQAKGRPLNEKERKELVDVSRNFANLALVSAPYNAAEINRLAEEQKQWQDRVQELKNLEETLRTQKKPDVLGEFEAKELANARKQLTDVTNELIKKALPTGVADVVVDLEGKPVKPDTIAKGDPVHGKKLFMEKGCLACHSHEKTEPTITSEANFGPNLSRIAQKLGPDGGDALAKKKWLVQWIINPTIHSPRTRMPVTFLTPQDASDVAEWLLSEKGQEYKEEDPSAPTNDTLVDMARVYFSKAAGMTAADVDEYLPKSSKADDLPPGINDSRKKYIAADADEQALLTDKGETVSRAKLLWYIGRKSINRLGCYGCHDIPGFETAKPVGVALNDWGKKDPERIAFEDSPAFVEEHFNIVENRDDEKDKSKPDPRWEKKDGKEPYEKYFAEAVEHHHREGFLHLKLVAPRSYDFKRLRTWDDRLRMPQFQFSRPRRHKGETDADYENRKTQEEAQAREAVMTFVLGLVADPIPLKYVNMPTGDKAAEVKGRQTLDKFNCAGCHQLRPGVYEFKSSKDALERLEKSFNLAAGNNDTVKDRPALKGDHVFPVHNAWVGIPSPYPDRMTIFGVDPKAELADREDSQDIKDRVLRLRLADALRFTNNEHVLRDIPASSSVVIPERDVLSRSDMWGGTFVNLLVGRQNEDGEWLGYLTKTGDFKNKPDDARSTLPPPLTREGERVQTKWLYQFLLNPTPVRPQTHMKLRMPRFNMSPEEAQSIVNYFAAVSKTSNPGIGLTYPYETIPQRDPRYWAARSQEYNSLKIDDQKLEVRAKAQLADLELLAADLKKDEKKKDELTDVEKKIKTLKDDIEKKKFSDLSKQWKAPDAYSRDAYSLLTNRNICLKCHSIGNIKIEGPVGPPLDLAAERLRPEWTVEWISNPKRLFTYNTQMPQNFPNDQKDEHTNISKQWLGSFWGSPRDQARAARDALMDLPRLSAMPADKK